MSEPCKDCDNYTDGICCQSRPKLSRAFNFFNLPKTVQQAKADDRAFDDEAKRKMLNGTLVVGHLNTGNC